MTTVGTEVQANHIAEELVLRRHAACVNIAPVHRSIYRWKGKVCEDSEYLLLVKTLESEFSAVESAIRELHNYELPEILSFRVDSGEGHFLEWIEASLDKTADFSDEIEDRDIS